jgi:hypothetical protein
MNVSILLCAQSIQVLFILMRLFFCLAFKEIFPEDNGFYSKHVKEPKGRYFSANGEVTFD